MRETTPAHFSDNVQRQRFELVEQGLTAFATYRRSGDRLAIPHVESPPPLRGKGTADRLMHAVAAYAGERALKVTPLCGYARSAAIPNMRTCWTDVPW